MNERTAEAQLSENTILFSEFFEEAFRFDPGSAPVDILNNDPDEAPFGELIEIIDSNTAIITSSSELFRFDISAQQTTLITDLSFVPDEITRDTTGNLIATGASGVISVNVSTGDEVSVFDEPFFSPADVVVSTEGLIYAIEFFDGLGVVNPDTQTFSQIGDFDPNELTNIDIGIDGNLIVSNIDNEFLQIDPITGNSTLLGSTDVGRLIEIKVDNEGDILYAGTTDGVSSIFSLDPITGVTTTILNGDDVDAFFSILDFDTGFNLRSATVAVPEPSSVALLGMMVTVSLARRRRVNV